MSERCWSKCIVYVPYTIIQGAVEVLPDQVTIGTRLEYSLIAQSVWYVVEHITLCCTKGSVLYPRSRDLESHLLTPNFFHILAEIELWEWLHDKFDNHQAMLMSSSNALHEPRCP